MGYVPAAVGAGEPAVQVGVTVSPANSPSIVAANFGVGSPYTAVWSFAVTVSIGRVVIVAKLEMPLATSPSKRATTK